MSVVLQDNAPFEWAADARFAVYYAPSRESSWWQAGCEWLGRDPESGAVHAPPQPSALSRAVSDLTRAPRRYGWHGTLVPPFRLGQGTTQYDLLAAAQAWARTQTPFALAVEAARLGDFVALRPAGTEGDEALRTLASDALRTLAALRAVQEAAELERRLAAPLTERQRALTVEWGYPYVFDEFRFHMTLSDSLASTAERDALVAYWHEAAARLGPLQVDSAAIFVEPAPGAPFVLWQRLPFRIEQTERE